ncbi:hypothetical protein HDU77_007058 [Chytriomyces hyalinus]|nr:hypothetical protein HDU77_007058 [Chytriomyces hyalinus]
MKRALEEGAAQEARPKRSKEQSIHPSASSSTKASKKKTAKETKKVVHPYASKEYRYMHVRLIWSSSLSSKASESLTQDQFSVTVERALRDMFGIVGAGLRATTLLLFCVNSSEAILQCPVRYAKDIRAAISLSQTCQSKLIKFDILGMEDAIQLLTLLPFPKPALEVDGLTGLAVPVNNNLSSSNACEWEIGVDVAEACGWKSRKEVGEYQGREDILEHGVYKGMQELLGPSCVQQSI